MGKIINITFVSLDGIINHMDAWHFDYTDEEHNRIAEEQHLTAEIPCVGPQNL